MTYPWTTYLLRYGIAAGLYGFTRGYRSTYHYNRTTKQYVPHQYLMGDRITMGIVNTLWYTNPVLGPLCIIRLMNRIEVCKRGWNPEDYPVDYCDGFGTYCPKVF